MASIFNNEEKVLFESLRDDVFDTFSRSIFIAKTPKEVIISSDTGYNFSYNAPDSQGNNDYVEYIPVSGVVQACLLYNKKQIREYANPKGSQKESFRIIFDDGDLRVKFKMQDYLDYAKDAINFQVDNQYFVTDTAPRPHGLFEPKYMTVFLKHKN